MLDEDGKLVAAKSGDGVRGTSAGKEPLGRGDQQPVAFGVTETVVDPLEVVEVEEEHRDRPPLALGESQRVAHAVAEERAIRQTGERIVKGLMRELLFQALPLADVTGVEDDAPDGRIVEQVGGQQLRMEP